MILVFVPAIVALLLLINHFKNYTIGALLQRLFDNEKCLFLILRNILSIYFVTKNCVKAFFGPIITYILYYYDYYTDLSLTYDYFMSCNFIYGSISLAIIIVSYISTVFYLRYTTNTTMKSALCYPIRQWFLNF